LNTLQEIEEILNARALENLIIIEQEKKKFAESYEETNQRNRGNDSKTNIEQQNICHIIPNSCCTPNFFYAFIFSRALTAKKHSEPQNT
jgi:hypothetical protein